MITTATSFRDFTEKARSFIMKKKDEEVNHRKKKKRQVVQGKKIGSKKTQFLNN